MNSQLPRQLELNVNALSRSFRQALRHATKTDPLGTEETSPAWRTVAARQAMLLTMLAAIGPFLQPPQPQPEESPLPQPETTVTAPVAPVDLGETLQDGDNDDDDDDDEVAAPAIAPEVLGMLPPDIVDLHRKMTAALQWPTHTHSQRTRRLAELQRLQETLDARVRQMTASFGAPPG